MTNPADMVPFAKTLGIKITKMDEDRVEAELLVRPEICTISGPGQPKTIHGGAVMTFADVVGAFAAYANLPEGAKGTTTSESKTNFLRPAAEGTTVHAICEPVKVGRQITVLQTKISDEDGKLVALVTQSQVAV